MSALYGVERDRLLLPLLKKPMKAAQILRRMFPTASAIAELHAIAKIHKECLDYQMDWINHLLDYQGQLLKRIQQLEDRSKVEQGLGPK